MLLWRILQLVVHCRLVPRDLNLVTFGLWGVLIGVAVSSPLIHAQTAVEKADPDGQHLLETFAKLDQHLAWNFDDLSLTNLVQLIEMRLGIKAEVDYESHSKREIDPSLKFKGYFSGAPASDALTFALWQHQLEWRTEGQGLVIATYDRFNQHGSRPYTIDYDLRFLVREHLQDGKLSLPGNATLVQLLDAIEELVEDIGSSGNILFQPKMFPDPGRQGWVRITQSEQVHFQIWKFLQNVARVRQFPHDPSQWGRHEEIWLALEAPLDWKMDSQPLQHLANDIAQRLNLPVWIDRHAFEEEGIDLERIFITGQFKATPTVEVLLLTLKPFDLTICIRGGGVVITTRTDAENKTEVRLFDLPPGFSAKFLAEHLPSESDTWPVLRTILMENVAPLSWAVHGGYSNFEMELILAGSDRVVLGVRNSTEIHYLLQGFLQRLTQIEHELNAETQPNSEDLLRVNSESAVARQANQFLRREALLIALSQTGEWSYSDQSLEELRARLQRQLNCGVSIDERELEFEGIDPQTVRVSGVFNGISLGESIELALNRLDEQWLRWNFSYDGLKLTTATDCGDGFVPMIFVLSRERLREHSDIEGLAEQILASVFTISWLDNGGNSTFQFLIHSDQHVFLFVHTEGRVLLALQQYLRETQYLADRP